GDGAVVAWGHNLYGQTSVPPGLSNVVGIAAGGYHSLALRSDGTIVAWGDNSFGQTNVPTGLRDVVAIAAGRAHSLALERPAAPPTILGFAGQTLFSGETILFEVTAVGALPLHYRWQ